MLITVEDIAGRYGLGLRTVRRQLPVLALDPASRAGPLRDFPLTLRPRHERDGRDDADRYDAADVERVIASLEAFGPYFRQSVRWQAARGKWSPPPK